MSLLDQMRELDISGIVSARGNISVSVNADGLQGLLGDGAIQTVLGSLGGALDQVRSLDSPEALLGPIINAVGGLRSSISSDDLPIADYIGAISSAVDIVVGLIGSISDGDLTKLSFPSGQSFGDMLGEVGSMAGRYAGIDLDGVGELRGLIDTVEGGFSGNAERLVEMAIDLLLPFGRASLGSIRGSLDTLFTGIGSIQIPGNATAALVSALDVVAVAAATGDPARLNEALRDLERARQNALELVRQGLGGFIGGLERLDLARHLGVIGDASAALRTGEDSVLEFMSRIRGLLVFIRETIEGADIEDVKAVVESIGDMLEARLRETIQAPIERMVEEVKAWLRGLLAHIPLRHYRGELTRFIKSIADAIQEADLDRYARDARAFLDQIESTIDDFDIAGEIQGVLQGINDAVSGSLGGIKDALESIVDEINALADTASSVLDQAATHLEQFQSTIEEVATLIEGIQIEQAGTIVVEKVRELREKAEELLSVAPLPDSLRPLVEQLIDTLEGIDFDEVLAPVHDAVAEFQIPDAVLETVNEVLDEASRLITNLITPELIASIDAEVQGLLGEIRKLNPASLLDGVSGYIDEAADFIEGLDPRPVVHELRGPFDTVMDALDAVRPDRLLAPAIDAYESLLSGVSLPSAESVMQGAHDAFNAAGEQLGAQLSRPLEQFTGGTTPASGGNAAGGSGNGSSGSGSSGSGSSGGSSSGSGSSGSGSSGSGSGGGSSSGSILPPQLQDVHAGDLIRMLGYLPAKLREALHELDAGVLGDVLRRIDSFSGGLARDLRRLQKELWAAEERMNEMLDTMMLPLGGAQIRAQLAIQASFSVGGSGVDVNLAMLAVASAGPGSFRSALSGELDRTRQDARRIMAGAGGRLGALLDRTATALERSSLSRLALDADAFLAALDPEPIAVELDELVNMVLQRIPDYIAGMDSVFQAAVARLLDLLRIFNPAVQAEKFLSVFDVVREELDLLNPRRLASELNEVHLAIRETVAAYDPDIFAQEVYDIVQSVAAKLRSLDPAALLGDLDLFGDITGLIESASPAAILSQLDTSLDALAGRLAALDFENLVESVEELPERVVTAVQVAIEGIRDEVKALLESIRYASSNASASASVSVEI